MDEQHRKILQSNRSSLVRDLDPSLLYNGLLSKGIFTQDMIDEIQSAGTRRDQARQLVKDLETRGSRAFPVFLECLLETGQNGVADFLQDGLPIQTPQPIPVQPVPIPVTSNPRKEIDKPDRGDGPPSRIISPYTPGKDLPPTQTTPVDETDPRPGGRPRSDSLQTYRMDTTPCGHCLIINNVDFSQDSKLNNRRGSDIDCDRLEKRFKSFSFDVVVKKNLTAKKIRHQLSALSKEDHSKYDCCVVIILSHGTEASHSRFPGAVHGVDGPIVTIQNITNYLNGQNCPSLQGKPKLFFIQACGGDEKDTGFEVSPDEFAPSSGGADDQMDAMPMSSSSDSLSTSDEPDARASLPTPSDILVCYSTFPGYVSWRDTEAGSWYVETLDSILHQYAATEDLVTMLMMVTDRVSQISAKGIYKQMPGSFNFLRKRLFFQLPSLCHLPAVTS
ncbi:caspase-9 [Amia ocellicauda]|uniref:caspase-9 n=1 Tax=Amia ocellicauda TaxID=2972642 RepID=UPI003463CC61